MSKKKNIVERLLNENLITAYEALELMDERQEIIDPFSMPSPNKTTGGLKSSSDRLAEWYDRCSCNPKNGGSGICGCVPPSPTTTY